MNCQTPLALARDKRVGLERALDERHVRQVERQTFGAEDAPESSAGTWLPRCMPSSMKSWSRP